MWSNERRAREAKIKQIIYRVRKFRLHPSTCKPNNTGWIMSQLWFKCLSPSHSPSLPQTLLVFSFTLAPSLPVGWGPQVGERGSRRRRQCLLFPHNNKGIHGHPAPHQSTETDGRNAKARGRTHEEEFRFPQGG